MPSHFSSIGMPVESEEDLLELAERAAEDATPLDAGDGTYLRWSSPGGAEVWLQIDADNQLIGMQPHFAGRSAVRVRLTNRLTRSKDTALDGAFHGWADPGGDGPEGGWYPFVFDAPDYQLHRDIRLPATLEVQIAAFAHEVSVFDSEDAFEASQEEGPKFSSESFIPSGLFSSAGEGAPEARAIFTGRILWADVRTNELTGGRFYWALVKTLGGDFDVVIDPELLEAIPPMGGILSGSFWLSGRLLDD